jgi:hypothetical protein
VATSWRYLLTLLAGITVLGAVAYPLLDASSPEVLVRNSQGQRLAVDDFAAASDPVTFGNLPWQQDFGLWKIENDQAKLEDGNPSGGPSYVTVETGASELRLSARADVISAGWGLVFRFTNPFDYAYVILNPDVASVNIGMVEGTTNTRVKVLSPAPMVPGQEVAVDIAGNRVTVTVDGAVVGQAELPRTASGTRAGLMGLAPAIAVARWDDVRFEGVDP